jgi:hypothetical protein
MIPTPEERAKALLNAYFRHGKDDTPVDRMLELGRKLSGKDAAEIREYYLLFKEIASKTPGYEVYGDIELAALTAIMADGIRAQEISHFFEVYKRFPLPGEEL